MIQLGIPDEAGVARYHQLATLFRSRIGSGEWAVGQQIPTIDRLAAEFSVAIATVRRALDGLADEGLLVRQKAKGTFVLRKPVESIWREIETDANGFLRTRGGSTFELLSRGSVDQLPFEPHDEGRPAPRYGWIRRLHWRDERPFVVIDVYMDAEVAAQLPQSRLEAANAQDLLAGLPGVEIVSLRQTLTIGGADLEAARILRIPLNSPVARIDRTRVDARGVAVLVSRATYRGDVVRLDFHEDPRRRSPTS